MIHFIYHRVVDNMRSNILYPLNQLKNIYPEAYATHIKKYEEREHLLSTKIPILNCLWNDVLHFTAVHPKNLFENLDRSGFKADELVWKRWFEIPIEALEPENIIICLYRHDISIIPEARDFHRFNPDKFSEYATIPPETIEYYKQQKASGVRPLFFHRVPHILYKGTVDISGFNIIEL